MFNTVSKATPVTYSFGSIYQEPETSTSTPPIPPINITVNVSHGDDELPIRQEVLDFAIDMETKLSMNEHKGHWGVVPVEELLRHVEEELAELKAAIYLNLSTEEIRFEAADTANFLMMLAGNYGDEHE